MPEPCVKTESLDGGVTVVSLRGRHDVRTRPALQESLDRAGGASYLIVDLSCAEHVDAAILRALTAAQVLRVGLLGRAFAIVAPESSAVRRPLEAARAHETIETFPTVEAALAPRVTTPSGVRGSARSRS
jgi:anti-anti-sigma regulatory factor